MGMPTDVPIIDLMLGIPSPDAKRSYDFMRPLFRDRESLESFEFPVEYMFKDVPKFERGEDAIQYTLEQMDRHRIERATRRSRARASWVSLVPAVWDRPSA